MGIHREKLTPANPPGKTPGRLLSRREKMQKETMSLLLQKAVTVRSGKGIYRIVMKSPSAILLRFTPYAIYEKTVRACDLCLSAIRIDEILADLKADK
jgi:hypothetical protein